MVHMSGIWTCDALFKAGRLASMWKGSRDSRPHVEMPGETVQSNQRKFMTKKDEEEQKKESVLTQTTLFLMKNEQLITLNETHRKEDEVLCKNCGGEVESGAGSRKW